MPKRHGHYCKVCGEHKANEKFSGSGHAAHICKACAKLDPAEREKQMTLNKISDLMGRHLSRQEIEWLKKHENDSRPEVRDAARSVYRELFPRSARNREKKGITVHAMEFFIHGEVWDEFGDEQDVHARFTMDTTGVLKRALIDEGIEDEVAVDKVEARKFLKSLVHEWDALFWSEDLGDGSDDLCWDEDWDDGFDEDEEWDGQDDEDEDVKEDAPNISAEPGEPIWRLQLQLNDGSTCVQTFYHQMHQEAQDLYLTLNEFFPFVDEEDL